MKRLHGNFQPGLRLDPAVEADWLAYHVIESLKNYIVYVDIGVNRASLLHACNRPLIQPSPNSVAMQEGKNFSAH